MQADSDIRGQTVDSYALRRVKYPAYMKKMTPRNICEANISWRISFHGKNLSANGSKAGRHKGFALSDRCVIKKGNTVILENLFSCIIIVNTKHNISAKLGRSCESVHIFNVDVWLGKSI